MVSFAALVWGRHTLSQTTAVDSYGDILLACDAFLREGERLRDELKERPRTRLFKVWPGAYFYANPIHSAMKVKLHKALLRSTD